MPTPADSKSASRPNRVVYALTVWLASALSLFPGSAPAIDWANPMPPSAGHARVIGQTGNGCIGGAVSLPTEGPGYMVMHLERRRYFGHPSLIRTLQALGKEMVQRGLGKLQIGDLAQPRGGPMPFGHRSHQNGLDVDIWFNLDPRVYAEADELRTNIRAPSMLNPDGHGLNRAVWSEHHVEMLKLAARQPAVDRIFVNPYIKRELCKKVRSGRDWLRKIRPWYYHDDHFHVRLRCPPDSPSCVPQEPVPPGDGCDAGLDWWFEPHPPGPAEPPAPKPPLPLECRVVLEGG